MGRPAGSLARTTSVKTSRWVRASREESGQQHSNHQSVGSSFTSGDLVELRSFFLGGRTGDDVQPSESDGSLESGLERFSPSSSASRSSLDVDEGNTEALGVGQKSASARVSAGHCGDIWPKHHLLKIRIFALQVLIFLFNLFPLCPHAKDLPTGDLCDAINDGGVEIGATFPHFAGSA
jgi:hypothetical protein